MSLVFGKANAKLIALEHKYNRKVYTFSVLSGFNCPGAKDCQSFAVRGNNGRLHIQDGKHTLWRCFSASQEVLFPSVYRARQNNQSIIEAAAISIMDAAILFVKQIPKNCGILRWHVGGEWKTQSYFDMGIEVAKMRPDILFYAYTKSLPFWVARLGMIPENFVLTASVGGRYDELIPLYGLRSVTVVGSEYQARKLRLPVDHDDSHAVKNNGKNFALTVHGVMPKGSKFAKAAKKQGYNRSKTLDRIGA